MEERSKCIRNAFEQTHVLGPQGVAINKGDTKENSNELLKLSIEPALRGLASQEKTNNWRSTNYS
jgi:hypothetical protein